jgi:hypothetical protein
MRKLGKDLKVGDTIRVWWSSFTGQKDNTDTIIRLSPNDGSLKHLWKDGSQFAWFQFNRIVGMTIDNGAYYEIVDK